jgi:hypothetical protein
MNYLPIILCMSAALAGCWLLFRGSPAFVILYFCYVLATGSVLWMRFFGENSDHFLVLSGINFRLLDPMHLPLMAAVGVALTKPQVRRNLAQAGTAPILFMLGFLVVKALLSISSFGAVAAFGEFRDFYAPLFLTVYIVLSLDRRRMGSDVRKSVGIVTLVGGANFATYLALYGGNAFSFDTAYRAFSGDNALIFVVVAAYFWLCSPSSVRKGRWRLLAALLLSAAIVANHRSVWLAAACAILVLTILHAIGARDVSVGKRGPAVLGVIVVAAAAVLLVLSSDGPRRFILGDDESSVVSRRLRAITNYEQDDNAHFRAYLWQERLSMMAADEWLWGRGLGDRRAVYFGAGEEGRTMGNHNAYVDMLEHGGLLLLGCYVFVLLRTLARLCTRLESSGSAPDRTFAAFCVVGICTQLAYQMAYGLHSVGAALLGVAMVMSSNALAVGVPAAGNRSGSMRASASS